MLSSLCSPSDVNPPTHTQHLQRANSDSRRPEQASGPPRGRDSRTVDDQPHGSRNVHYSYSGIRPQCLVGELREQPEAGDGVQYDFRGLIILL